MIQHQEYILAIKDAIKPGLYLCLRKSYNREMVAKYLNGIRKKFGGEDDRSK